jgi:hypothetical protein
MCKEKGIKLITIFSDQWVHKKDIVLRRLSAKLNIITDKIGARKTIIKELSKIEEKSFFLATHIQGYNPSRVCYGLFENDELVAAMSFKKVRYHSKELSPNDWELLRFSTTKIVSGGASKLFKHFVKTHNPIKIISYSDNDWNDGNVYCSLGFDLSGYSKPSYWYADVNKDKRYHRFNFRKKEGDLDMPEQDRVMNKFGYMRFWDTGNTRWIYNNR